MNNILNNYLHFIQEGLFFSDETISIDLDKFESGESNKLLIIGLLGGGKSTLGKYLSKKYNCKYQDLDDCIKIAKEYSDEKYNQAKKFYSCVLSFLKNKDRIILEGFPLIETWRLYEGKSNENFILKCPTIILGKSSLESSYDAIKRDKQNHPDYDFKQLFLFGLLKKNFSILPKLIEKFKQKRIGKNSNVQKFIIPKL